MAKTKKRSRPKNGKKEEEVKKPQPSQDDNEHNYGGLPERNLKKNLGCG